MNKISIIIPVLNEANTIANLRHYLIANSSSENIADIIVVDGGSSDGTKNIISSFISSQVQSKPHNFSTTLESPTIQLLTSAKGRAKQMNFGAKHATGNILYFLHADSFPPKDFDTLIIEKVAKGNEAGCFSMQFNSDHWWLKLAGWLTRFNWKVCRGGDQSLFITKSLFSEIGGYNENFTIYEDNDLIAKLYKLKQFTVIQKWLITSARHYNNNGVWKLQYHFMVIHLKKRFGASAEDLHKYYKQHIC